MFLLRWNIVVVIHPFRNPMTILLGSKEQVLSKMQELDAALQTAINARTEIWSLVSSLPDKGAFADIEIPLTFFEHRHIIAWGDDSEHFSSATFDLVRQLWFAPEHILSQEDIRQDVILDDDASDNAVWIRVKRARRELNKVNFPYAIVTLRGWGYRLTPNRQSVKNMTGLDGIDSV